MSKIVGYLAAFVSFIWAVMSLGSSREKRKQAEQKLDDHEKAMSEFKKKEGEANEKRKEGSSYIRNRNYFKLFKK